MIDTHLRPYVSRLLLYISYPFIKKGWHPLHMTFLALVLGFLGAIFFALSNNICALLFLWLSGICDCLDGEIARATAKQSSFGALCDIVFDRIVEILYILALALRGGTSELALLLLACAIILSMTVFLTAGALLPHQGKKSFYYQAGLIERTEAFIFFSLIILFSSYTSFLVYLFASLIFITAIQRFYEVYYYTKQEKDKNTP